MRKPEPTEYAGFFAKYVELVQEADPLPVLAAQVREVLDFLGTVSEADASVLHAPYTWTFKEVIGHVADGERVFGYRALRFARADATPLPGFDETAFAAHAESNRLPFAEVLADWEAARRSNVSLYRSLPDAAWVRGGTANGTYLTVRALAYIIAGHTRHHFTILKKRLGR
jgi:DinB superfamily